MFLNVLSLVAVAVLTFMSGVFVVGTLLKRNDIADVAWGIGFIVAFATALALGFTSDRAWLMFVLVTLWGVRLSTHIFLRWRRHPEDHRYAAWREAWGSWVIPRSFLQVYLLQGLLLLVIVQPLIWVASQSHVPDLQFFDIVPVLAWSVGFLFEAVGDFQLAQFKADPTNKGKVMSSGLWYYTRHPNYFGEALQWWAVFGLALAVPGSWWTVIGPLTITFLLLKVSGVTLLEQKYHGNPEYQAYQRSTSSFIPWFKKAA